MRMVSSSNGFIGPLMKTISAVFDSFKNLREDEQTVGRGQMVALSSAGH